MGAVTVGESATTEVSSSALPVQHQPVVRPHLKSAGARPCGRLAPSPTGALHLGNIRTFMVAWLQMRACGGEVRLRIEDLDHPKHKAGAADALIEDLRWLGFDWDGPIVRQSDRLPIYKEALERLAPLYPCFCSRADIQGAQSAPHPGEVLRYPGTCRRRVGPAPEGRIPAWRLPLGPEDDGRYVDAFAGPQTKTADALTGDFVLARGEDPAYVLAVVVESSPSPPRRTSFIGAWVGNRRLIGTSRWWSARTDCVWPSATATPAFRPIVPRVSPPDVSFRPLRVPAVGSPPVKASPRLPTSSPAFPPTPSPTPPLFGTIPCFDLIMSVEIGRSSFPARTLVRAKPDGLTPIVLWAERPLIKLSSPSSSRLTVFQLSLAQESGEWEGAQSCARR